MNIEISTALDAYPAGFNAVLKRDLDKPLESGELPAKNNRTLIRSSKTN
ncbi:hypothetical protein AB3F25_03985 [Aggregatibacter sp. HMT-949]